MIMRILTFFKRIPLIRDAYAHFWEFERRAPTCRGLFSSFQAALTAAPKSRAHGYGQSIIASHPEPARLTAMQEVGGFDQRDYPVLVWLARAFETESGVFDLGGNVGLAYYAYRKFIRYPEALRWTVCEIPELCRRGEQMAREHHIDHLEFSEDFRKAEGKRIFLTCGTLQYLEEPLPQRLSKLNAKPRHLLIQRVPLTDGPSYYTLQNIGYAFCPYHIQNRKALFESLAQQGYRLIDSWKDSRICRVPFHPAQTVAGYSGAYFQRDAD
jgi:putative methyltransferase (TIGR04325 family)